MNGYEVFPFGGEYNACGHEVTVGGVDKSLWGLWTPAGTMWMRTWVHNTHDAYGRATSSWSGPSAWHQLPALGGGYQWRFSPVYYPDEYKVQFYELSPSNTVMGNVSFREIL